MLSSKTKINVETRRLVDLLEAQHVEITTRSVGFLEEQQLFRPAVSVIYSTLINYTVPVKRKMAALYLLKAIFQTAHPTALQECTRVVPVLADIIRNRNSVNQYPSSYLIVIEGRPMADPIPSQQFVRFSQQVLKQWAQYMEDCQQTESPFFSKYAELSRRTCVHFPSWFQWFTLADYVEFMLNWMRRKRKQHVLLDKLDIFYFLSSETEFNKKFGFYRQHLAENAQAIATEAYSILVNHSLPVQAKFVSLRALRELYQEANLLFCEKVDEQLMPYLAYIVELMVKQLPPEKYFERIERRLGVEPQQSRQFIITVLHLIKLWDQYNSKATVNPYVSLCLQIDKKNMLTGNDRPNFSPQQIMRFTDNQNFGKHREPEYREPPKKKIPTEMELRLMEDVKRLERMLQEMKQRDQTQNRELKDLQGRLEGQRTESNQFRERMEKELYEARLQIQATPAYSLVKEMIQHKPEPKQEVLPPPTIVITDVSNTQLTKQRERHIFKCVELTHPTPSKLHYTFDEQSTLQRSKLRPVQSQKNLLTGLKMSDLIRLREQRYR